MVKTTHIYLCIEEDLLVGKQVQRVNTLSDGHQDRHPGSMLQLQLVVSKAIDIQASIALVCLSDHRPIIIMSPAALA